MEDTGFLAQIQRGSCQSSLMERVKSKYGCTVIVDLALPGAGSLLTFLQHPVCMWDMTSAYPKEVTEFVPCVCPVQPEPGKAFCGRGVYI